MRTALALIPKLCSQRSPLLLACVLPLSMLMTGCGSGGGPTTPPVPANTSVTLFASSTANDQLAAFAVTLTGLTLTNQSGSTVTVIAKPVSGEFMHLNGNIEPLVTVSVPQGVYTSATVTSSSDLPACVGQDTTAKELLTDEVLVGPNSGATTVSLPAPVTIGANTVALTLTLQVSSSAPFIGGCSPSLTNAVPVNPTFTLAPMTIAPQPTNPTNGKALGLQGLIDSINADGSGLMINDIGAFNADATPSWQITLNGSTVFQGVTGASQLADGMPVDMDLAIQPDGTLLATRIFVPDTTTANLSVASGLTVSTRASQQQIQIFQVEQAGNLPGLDGGFSYATSSYRITPQFTNLQTLPFTPTFSAATQINGQNILYTAHPQDVNGFLPIPIVASTMTLLPQTIDGNVTAISTAGSFTTYTISLAAYDLFNNLDVQPGHATLINNPNTMVVYADTNTQVLNATPASVGSTVRFNGLVFDDNGTLRMDCAQIYDGVPQ